MHKHCQIPGCCCHRIRELIESQGFRLAPYHLLEMGSSSSSSSGTGSSRQAHRATHQLSSTDSDSDYHSGSNRRRRPMKLSLWSDVQIPKNLNLHPHYHLTTKSHLRRVTSQVPTNHRRSRSISDLTPLTETPVKTPAVGGSTVPNTPIYSCQGALGEDTSEQDGNICTNQPMLLREISISADNIPALCLNDCPFTPSPLKEGHHLLAKDLSKARRGTLRSAKPKLKPVQEATSSVESDDSRTSSPPDKSSQSEDDGIDVCIHPQKRKSVQHQKQETLIINDTLRSPPGTKSSQHDGAADAEVRKNAMSNPHMRRSRSVSPLSVCSQVSGHSRRSAAPYETEVVRKQNGIVSETTEC